jgi:hypothetical protein
MIAAPQPGRYARAFSARKWRRCAVAPLFRAVCFRPGFESVEQRTLLSTIVATPTLDFGNNSVAAFQGPTVIPATNAPAPSFVGDFDGQSDLLTVDAGSNELTLISGFDGPTPVTSTITSGGVDPSVAFAFATQTGYDNLLVGNTGDGVLALFNGTPEGLTLHSAQSVPGLRDASGLLVSTVSGREIQFFVLTSQPQGLVATEGPFVVVLSNPVSGVPQFFGPVSVSSPPSGSARASQGSSGVAQLVPLQESSLALIGTLLPLTIEATASGLASAGETQAVAALVPSATAPASLGQSLLGRGERSAPGGAGTEGQPLTLAGEPAGLGNPRAAAWQHYTLGTGEALERFDREHPELFQRSSEDASGTNSGTGQNEDERAKSAGTSIVESSTPTPSRVVVADVAGEVFDLICDNDSLAESPRWWRDDATGAKDVRLARNRNELSACVAFTSVVAGCLYFGAAGERGKANGRRNGARRRRWI